LEKPLSSSMMTLAMIYRCSAPVFIMVGSGEA
jgi:hypothetical protein